MSEDRLGALADAGVSIWLDDLSRARLTSGSLAADVASRHVVGVTTNPSIFAKAVGDADVYAAPIAALEAAGAGVDEAVRALTTADVRDACDVLRPVFEATDGVDGWVSIEVEPSLAHDTAGTVEQARELHAEVDRPNVLVKIPATSEGLPAIRQVLGAGIPVNVTLIFALDRYAEVVDAFLEGVEDALAAGRDVTRLGSVASFFVSRVDSEVDARLDAMRAESPLRGAAAVANARLAFEHYEATLATDRWAGLASRGAKPQRPLWASTGTKDPAFSDTKYVEELVTRGVVNTMPQATIDAFADHGIVRADTVRGSYAGARAALADIAAAGVDLADVTAQLEREGVEKFAAAWEELRRIVAAALTR